MTLKEDVGGATRPIPPVWACINVFDDAYWLRKCLESLRGKVEGIVVVDGAYEYFPHSTAWSTDGTLELAEEYADVVVTTEQAWENEIIKRDAYLKHVPDGKWWLRIDADEELEGWIPNDLADICYMVSLKRTDLHRPYPIHAVFKKHETSRYFGCHHAVWYKDEILVKREDWKVLDGCALIHHSHERDRERWDKKGAYYKAMVAIERAFRAKNGL